MHGRGSFRCGVSDSCRAETGFVRERAAPETPDERFLERDTGGRAEDGARAERGSEYLCESAADVPGVGEDDAEADEHVEQAHDRDELFSDFADALDAAEQDQRDESREGQTDDPVDNGNAAVVYREEGGDGVRNGAGDGVHLTHVADAEARDAGESCVHHCQPLPLRADAGDVIHRAAYPVALFIALAVLNGEHDLRVLYDHAKQRGDPQPKHSAVAAEGDGLRGTDYIAGADSGGKSGGHGLKRRDGAFSGFRLFEHLADGVFHGVSEVAELHCLGADGQQYAADHDAGQEHIQPREVVKSSGEEIDKCLHACIPLI